MMNLKELINAHQLIDLFVQLVRITSPSKKEQQVSKKILQICKEHNLNAEYDSYGNVIVKIPASRGFENIEPLFMSSHMDVVGASEPVNVRLSQDGKYIETDKNRTLGADNKAGIAAILDLAIN